MTVTKSQFASACNITAMLSPAARFIGAASDGGKKAIQALLKEGIINDNNNSSPRKTKSPTMIDMKMLNFQAAQT